jgi:hypothetical protein
VEVQDGVGRIALGVDRRLRAKIDSSLRNAGRVEELLGVERTRLLRRSSVGLFTRAGKAPRSEPLRPVSG